MLSRSSVLILPRPTSRSINSTIAGQRSVAFISGMICSAESRFPNDMRKTRFRERKLTGGGYIDKRISGIVDSVIQSPREEPADAKHVHRRPPCAAAEAILGLTKAPWPMIHWNLDQFITRAPDQRRNKAVHSFEWNERNRAFAPHRFERAPCVAHVIFRETATNKISDPAGQPFCERVLAFRPITANQIRATRNLRQQSWNVSRIVLQVAVDHDDCLSARGL